MLSRFSLVPSPLWLATSIWLVAGCLSDSEGGEADPEVPPLDTGAAALPDGGGVTLPDAGGMVAPDSGMEAVRGDADLGADASEPIYPDLRCRADESMAQGTDYAQSGPFAVGTLEMTFVDSSRPILAKGTRPAESARTLVTTIHYPASSSVFGGAELAAGGPFPLLMYSHGYSSTRGEAAPLASRAASYGYVVVAPDFPLTNLLASGGPDVSDAASQPGDISFLIDQVLALSRDPNHRLAGAIDEERIGAVGVSLGGLTTLLVTFHPELHDPRIKVAMPIAALSSFFAPGFYHTRDVPLLFVHGDLDAFVEYELNARRAFARAAPSAHLVTIAKGSHAAFGAPFDPVTLPLINALIGLPDADPSNPDGVGCGAVSQTLSNTGPGFLESLGGPESFVEPDDGPLPPCDGDEYTHPAINPLEQEEIAVRSAVAFFDAHFASKPETRQDGCRYLRYELPKHPAVTLE